MGDPNVPWLWPGPDLAAAAIREVNQPTVDLSLPLPFYHSTYQINTQILVKNL